MLKINVEKLNTATIKPKAATNRLLSLFKYECDRSEHIPYRNACRKFGKSTKKVAHAIDHLKVVIAGVAAVHYQDDTYYLIHKWDSVSEYLEEILIEIETLKATYCAASMLRKAAIPENSLEKQIQLQLSQLSECLIDFVDNVGSHTSSVIA